MEKPRRPDCEAGGQSGSEPGSHFSFIYIRVSSERPVKEYSLDGEQMSVQSMIRILSSFGAIYDRMNAAKRRGPVKYLISEVELFPREEQKALKRFVRAIAYKLPIEQKVLTQFDECGASVETVVRPERAWVEKIIDFCAAK